MKKGAESIYLRFPKATKAWIKQQAKKNQMSVNTYILWKFTVLKNYGQVSIRGVHERSD